MKITVKKRPVMLFLFADDCWGSSSCLEGQFASSWEGVAESSSLFSHLSFLSVPDLLSPAVISPACDPSVVNRVLFFSKPRRALHGDGLCNVSMKGCSALASCCPWPGRGS